MGAIQQAVAAFVPAVAAAQAQVGNNLPFTIMNSDAEKGVDRLAPLAALLGSDQRAVEPLALPRAGPGARSRPSPKRKAAARRLERATCRCARVTALIRVGPERGAGVAPVVASFTPSRLTAP